MKFTFASAEDVTALTSDCLVVLAGKGAKGPVCRSIQAAGGLLGKLEKQGDLPTDHGKSTTVLQPAGLKANRLLYINTQSKSDLAATAVLVCRELAARLLATGSTDAAIVADAVGLDDAGMEALLEPLARELMTASYRYAETLSSPPAPAKLKRVKLIMRRKAALSRALERGKAVGEGINVARHLGDLPGNYCTPRYLSRRARQMARQNDALRCSVLDEKKMKELGMGSLLSVTAGTQEPAQFIVMEYQGAAKKQAPHVLVGKGITFDSGGISIKPGARMDEMKYDMCGAASVFGTMHTVSALGLPLNVVGIVAAVENMPDGKATKPGDVVTSMAGKTIEVLNTDAEGRLVLCDALTYAARYKPETVVDIATLTGACVVALGKHATGLYANDDDLANALITAGERTRDRAWRMPLWDEYQGQLKSNFADIANIGGPEAGSVTAACFLSRFTGDFRWAHLDIAGSAWNNGAQKGATGRPVALLSQYLFDCAGKH